MTNYSFSVPVTHPKVQLCFHQYFCGSFGSFLILEFYRCFLQHYFREKRLFSSTRLCLLSWTGTGNSGNFPSQIFRSPPYYLLPPGNIFFGYFSHFWNFLLNFSPLDTCQIFWLPASIFSKWHSFHLILLLISFLLLRDTLLWWVEPYTLFRM